MKNLKRGTIVEVKWEKAAPNLAIYLSPCGGGTSAVTHINSEKYMMGYREEVNNSQITPLSLTMNELIAYFYRLDIGDVDREEEARNQLGYHFEKRLDWEVEDSRKKTRRNARRKH